MTTGKAGEWGSNDDLAVHRIDLRRPHPALCSYLYVCLWIIELGLQQPLSPLSFSLHPSSLSLSGWLGWDLIKLTWGNTDGSGCSQRPRSALCWTTQWDDNCTSIVASDSRIALQIGPFLCPLLSTSTLGLRKLTDNILFLLREARQSYVLWGLTVLLCDQG